MLWVIWILVMLSLWVVNAWVTEPYGHIEYTLNETENFEAQVITISYWSDTITILDRNLWATTAGTWCEDPDWSGLCAGWDDTYWYFFQWWNNYWFKWTGTVLSGTGKAIRSGIYSNKWYYSPVFLSSDSESWWDYWNDSTSSNHHLDLRWWSRKEDMISERDLDNGKWKLDSGTTSNKRGPCPENFHIPSYWELLKLKAMMWDSSSYMHWALLIPYAWIRYNSTHANGVGSTAHLWASSSPQYEMIAPDADNDIVRIYGDSYTTANSIRCFYNYYDYFPETLNLIFISDNNERTWTVTENTIWFVPPDVSSIIKDGYEFMYWYWAGDDDTIRFDFENEAIPLWMADEYNNVYFIAKRAPKEYKIDYKLNDGVTSWENITWYTIESQNITLINPTKIGYTFTWWSGTDIDGFSWAVVIPSGSTWDRNYEANWQINQYTITFDTDWWTNIPPITADYWTWITVPANPTKNGYKFIGWEPEIPTTMPAGNITVKAKWEKNWSSGWWGWGGWWGWSSKSDTPKEEQKTDGTSKDQASSWTTVKEPETTTGNKVEIQTWNKAEIQTWNVVDTPEQAPENDNPVQDTTTNNQQWQNNTQRWWTYSPEFQQAYEFAHEKWITTMPTIEKANMDGKLTRIAMAKMLSQYAMNVLWQKPANIITPKFNDVTDKQNSDYDDWVTLAYQLWIMWQNMPNNKFRPNDEVTRAEFATALSRMAYWTSDWEYKWTWKYYIHHMEKLVKEWVITKDDPNMKELRGYVMIMLMRSAK